jgi:hypothetical protein
LGDVKKKEAQCTYKKRHSLPVMNKSNVPPPLSPFPSSLSLGTPDSDRVLLLLVLVPGKRRTDLTAAAGAAGLHTLALADLHGRLVVHGGVAHALLDLAGHGEESLLDVAGVLGGSLEEGDAKAVRKLLWDVLVPRLIVLA